MVPADAQNAQRAPQRLGKYPVLGQIGKGAMGVVYKSFDPDIKRPIALKTIRKELLHDEEEAAAFGARFRNEAQAAGRLLHPGIVAVHEYGEDEQFAFIAMEYVEGKSLRQYFERKVRFSERDVVSIMAQLLDALQFAHEQGVWHRDIKPGNIIIMNNGRVKIADFGIARVESSTLTQVGVVMGTPGFIAPEQYLGKEVDHRIDVFASGVVLYELLTGVTPFGGSKEGVMYQICHEAVTPPSVSSSNADLARFDPVVLRALAKNPQDRYASAQKFRAELLASYDQPVSPSVSEETLIRDAGGSHDVPEAMGRGSARGSTPSPSRQPSAGSRPSKPQNSTMPTEMIAAAGWNLAELDELERNLARFLGPIAKVMVRRATRDCDDFGSLTQKLADLLRLPADRTSFLEKTAVLAATGTGPNRLPVAVDEDATIIPGAPSAARAAPAGPTPDDVVRAGKLLARYLGPIAQVLARQAAQPGVARSAFLAQMTERLSAPERERFLIDFERSR